MNKVKLEEPRRRLILAFVVNNPDCSSREVADAFGMESKHIGSELDQLAKWGFVTGEKDGRRMYWTATGKEPQDGEKGEVPRQTVRKEWTPHLVRDPLHTAFFGAVAA